MQPADLSIALRRRTPWEACDLGLSMLQQWWRPVYGAHLTIGIPVVATALALAWVSGQVWVAFAIVWWLKPLYDRVVLHVLSRAVFGEIQPPRTVLAHAREWLGTGLLTALTFARFDLARSFNLPVRQLEGLGGGAGRRRREILGRRARGHAIWLTTVCLHLEAVVMLSLDSLLDLLIPAKASEGLPPWVVLFQSAAGGAATWTLSDAAVYAAAVLLFEPFYVAAGFGLYLNRRILLEGWDLEVALRAIGEKRAAKPPAAVAAAVMMFCLALCAFTSTPYAQPAKEPQSAARDPRIEMAEVLKDAEFGRWTETTKWQRRSPEPERRADDPVWLRAFGHAFGSALQVLAWIAAAALLVWLVWRLLRALPAEPVARRETYRPPATLFGLELAPESLPADVAGAAEALAREGRMREALGLLYRGMLSELVHKRNVELLASHTEGEVLRLARAALGAEAYPGTLVGAWAACAYARRVPAGAEVERLSAGYRAAFA